MIDKNVDNSPDNMNKYRIKVETFLVKMNHELGSDDFMEIMGLIQETCDDNLTG